MNRRHLIREWCREKGFWLQCDQCGMSPMKYHVAIGVSENRCHLRVYDDIDSGTNDDFYEDDIEIGFSSSVFNPSGEGQGITFTLLGRISNPDFFEKLEKALAERKVFATEKTF